MATLLNILKIIGMILLVILAVLLVLLLLVLFVPVVYQAEGKKQEQLYLKVRVSWLFPFIYGKLVYKNELSCNLYCLGILVYHVFGEEKHKKKKKGNEKESKRSEDIRQKKNQEIGLDSFQNASDTFDIMNQLEEEADYSESVQKEEQEKEQKKIKSFFLKIKLFIQKIIEKIKNIKYTILNVKDKFVNLKDTISWYVEVLTREESKNAISKGKAQLFKLFKHIGPRKIKGSIVFGFDDPAVTGEVLGLVSMFYAFYGNHITILPVFDEEIFLGDFYIKGRLRVFTLLKIGWSILFDKEIKNLYSILTGGKENE